MWPGQKDHTVGTSVFANVTSITGIADTTVSANYAGYSWSGPDPTPDVFDERHNPKMWAQWFREFLEELLGAGQAVLKEARQRHPLTAVEQKCRSAPLFRREWILKSWKQTH